MATDTTDYSKYSAIIVSLLALGYTLWKDRKMNKRMKKVEEEQVREKAEAATRRSKASAPYFSPSKKMVGQLYDTTEEGGLTIWMTRQYGNVLSIERKEIGKDAPEMTPVIIVLDTGGKGARRIKVSGDIQDLEFKQEPDVPDANGLVFLKYPFTPTNHGKTQKVVLSFETEDGLELTHTYETRHGHFEFYRIDPK
jgi:hypothetical protein